MVTRQRASFLVFVLLALQAVAIPPAEIRWWQDSGAPKNYTPPRARHYLPPILVVDDLDTFEPKLAEQAIVFAADGAPEEASVEIFANAFGLDFAKYLNAIRFAPARFQDKAIASVSRFGFPLFFVFEDPGGAERVPPGHNHEFALDLLDLRYALDSTAQWLVADLTIDESGRIEAIRTAHRSGHDQGLLEEAFAAEQARTEARPLFVPAREGGSPTRCRLRLYWHYSSQNYAEEDEKPGAALAVGDTFPLPDPARIRSVRLGSVTATTDRLGKLSKACPRPDATPQELVVLAEQTYPPNSVLTVTYSVGPKSGRLAIEEVRESPLVEPKLITKVAPEFPKSRVEGTFRVRMRIATNGVPETIEILQTPHKVYNRFLLRALKQWRYEPATRGGQAVECMIELTLPYNRKWYEHPEPIPIDAIL